jgi:hypothetical protein
VEHGIEPGMEPGMELDCGAEAGWGLEGHWYQKRRCQEPQIEN